MFSCIERRKILLRELIQPGDLVFGLGGVLKKIKSKINCDGIYSDYFLEQAELTNATWPYGSSYYLSPKHDNFKSNTAREFGLYLTHSERYHVAELFRKMLINTSIDVFKKTSKGGLDFQLLHQKRRVHFFLDGINLKKVSIKSSVFGKSVTASELRWLYRRRHMPYVSNLVIFWENYKIISHNDFFSKEEWLLYNPQNTYL